MKKTRRMSAQGRGLHQRIDEMESLCDQGRAEWEKGNDQNCFRLHAEALKLAGPIQQQIRRATTINGCYW